MRKQKPIHSRDAIRARGMPYNASKTPPSTIASRLNRRWDRLRLDHARRTKTCPSWVSALGRTSGRTRWLNPPYKLQTTNKKEAERRQAHVFRWSASSDAARALS